MGQNFAVLSYCKYNSYILNPLEQAVLDRYKTRDSSTSGALNDSYDSATNYLRRTLVVEAITQGLLFGGDWYSTAYGIF